MLVNRLKSLEDLVKGFATFKRDKLTSSTVQHVSFEQQLLTGLNTPLGNLDKNPVGFSYRKSPVFIYGLVHNPNRVHVSSKCSELQNTNQWGWVASDATKLEQTDLFFCEECAAHLQLATPAPDESSPSTKQLIQTTFLTVIKRNAYAYFRPKAVSYWQPGHSLKPLEIPDTTEALDESSCHHCTWSTSEFLLDSQSFKTLATKKAYCYACINEQGDDCFAIPKSMRWQALQARHKAFNGICNNWAHLMLHMDKSWHELVLLLRKQGVTLPMPFYVVEDNDVNSENRAMATLAWPNRKQGIIPDGTNKTDFPDDWQLMHYSEILPTPHST